MAIICFYDQHTTLNHTYFSSKKIKHDDSCDINQDLICLIPFM